MVRIRDTVIFAFMTAKTFPRQSACLIVNMTTDTLDRYVRSAYLKTGYFQMVKNGIPPLIFIMAGFTVRRKTKFCMIRIIGSEIVLAVTGITIMRCACIGGLVTTITVHTYMGTF